MRNRKLLTAASELLNFLVMALGVFLQMQQSTIAIVLILAGDVPSPAAPDATSSSVTIAATQPSEEPPADPTTADPYLQLAQ
ncbi:hypothetical protein PC111_g12439 [Phytophthora cactorum]|nr:hypothetical protein PC112_g13549 [Phytophthora cactorum]KAG2818077.1 hypothetical protein PC111_g12439 [Phytophthora cactorum]